MWLRNHLSQISADPAAAADTRVYASDSPNGPLAQRADLNAPEDYLRMKEWIGRVQAAAQKARNEYTEDQAARARQLEEPHPDFDNEDNMNCSEAEETASEDCTDGDA